jgi:hypothetical protein
MKESNLCTLEEKCINNREHKFEPFIYLGVKSDFEEICRNCGNYKINEEGLYSQVGLIHYIHSDRYKLLLQQSESIKNEIAKREDIPIFGD